MPSLEDDAGVSSVLVLGLAFDFFAVYFLPLGVDEGSRFGEVSGEGVLKRKR